MNTSGANRSVPSQGPCWKIHGRTLSGLEGLEREHKKRKHHSAGHKKRYPQNAPGKALHVSNSSVPERRIPSFSDFLPTRFDFPERIPHDDRHTHPDQTNQQQKHATSCHHEPKKSILVSINIPPGRRSNARQRPKQGRTLYLASCNARLGGRHGVYICQ